MLTIGMKSVEGFSCSAACGGTAGGIMDGSLVAGSELKFHVTSERSEDDSLSSEGSAVGVHLVVAQVLLVGLR